MSPNLIISRTRTDKHTDMDRWTESKTVPASLLHWRMQCNNAAHTKSKTRKTLICNAKRIDDTIAYF